MNHFKKVRLIPEYFPKKPLSLQNPEDSNCDAPESDKFKDNAFQKESDLNYIDLEQIENLSDPQTNSNELNVEKEENIGQVSKLIPLKRVSDFEPPRQKRIAFGGSDCQVSSLQFDWKFVKAENLNVKYCKIYAKTVSDKIFEKLEKEVQYLKPEDSKVQVYGKWHQIPRKHAAYGEEGITYTFSNTTLPAKSWDSCPTILELKKVAEIASGETYNFVLINRYENGTDYMGDHKDNESDLVAESAISSFSFGQGRDFILKYDKKKLKDRNMSGIPSIKQYLESGSLLIMEYPTNVYWYHCLPVRKNALGVRVNLTFRSIVNKANRNK